MLFLLLACGEDEPAPTAPSENDTADADTDTDTDTDADADTDTGTLADGWGMRAAGRLNETDFDFGCYSADTWAGELSEIGSGYSLLLQCGDTANDIAVTVEYQGADPTGTHSIGDTGTDDVVRVYLGTLDTRLLSPDSPNVQTTSITTTTWDATAGSEHWVGTFEASWSDTGDTADTADTGAPVQVGSVTGEFDVLF